MALINCKAKGFDKFRERLERVANANDSAKPNDAILDVLRAECNELIADGRLNGAYTDRTSNLRSSIGCSIYFQGKLIENKIDAEATTDGATNASRALQQYAQTHPDKISQSGYTLLLVAGMSYGRYVEAKGFNVLHLTIQKGEADVAKIRERVQRLVSGKQK